MKSTAGGYMATCPAHQDSTASLKVSEGDKGAVLHCHAGCDTTSVLTSLGLDFAALFDDEATETGVWMPGGATHAASYDYTDEAGRPLFQVLRSTTKDFYQRTADPGSKSGWRWNLNGVRRVPYRLPAVLAAVREGRTIWITEGEKDVAALEAKGQVATCNPGGAGKWRDDYDEFFRGARVVIVADRDEPGQRHARQVAEHLRPVAAYVEVVESRFGKDASDHFGGGGEVGDFTRLSVEGENPIDMLEDVLSFIEGEDHYNWVVPHLLERMDRLVLTGFEGKGKSVLIRQLAIMLAAGVHPFTQRPIDPVRVMLVDCENGEAFSRRKFRELVRMAESRGTPVQPEHLRIKVRTQGMDLMDSDDRAWLMERVRAHRPDVLFIGPLYRLHNEDPNKAQPARALQQALDDLRTEAGCALVMEAHAGHGSGMGERGLRPEGHSSWMRWSEFGFGLAPTKDNPKTEALFRQWRGPRDERDWPTSMNHGGLGNWPWQATYANGMPSRPLQAVPDSEAV